MNISDIAKLAQVSPATVSRYLNNGYVSKEKKERIKKVVEQTGYIPSASAQTLRTRKNNLIGVIVPKISSESVSKMVEGVTNILKNTKYNILLANTDNSVDKELEFLSIFKDGTVDGVIFIATIINKKHRKILDSYKKPIVILSQYDSNISCVYYDDFGASYDFTNRLIKYGCKNIAYIGVTTKDKSAGKARLEGFLSALKNNNIPVNTNLIVESNFTSECSYNCMERLLNNGERFDGVFCATDNIALGVMKSLKEHKLNIPKDIKVVGIGNSKMARLCNPTLSSAQLYYISGGEEACKMVLDGIQKNYNIFKQYKLGYEIIERQSTREDI